MGSRRKSRELALQALYQVEITGDVSDAALRALEKSFDVNPAAREFAMTLVRGVLEERVEIDRLIAEAAENWRLERLSRTDVNVIRISVFEMTATPPLPVEIAIDEAIEVARRFGTLESANFVNGVLDRVAARLGLKALST